MIREYIPDNLIDGLNHNDKLINIRQIRDTLFRENVDKINAVRWSAMTPEKQAEWTAYRQALLDITKCESAPSYVTWPTKPE